MADILVIEDEAIVALHYEMELIELGHNVVGLTDNGADAVRMAREKHPDIVLMDIVLKGSMNGIEACRMINRENCGRVIYITGHSDHATIELAGETPHSGILFKPVETQQLKEAIENALR